jgi:hypothetical protein
MSRRNIHVMKSPEEYKEYLDSVIRVTDTTPSGRDEETNATNQPAPIDRLPEQVTSSPTRRKSWLQVHWQGVVAGGIVTLVLGVVGWYGVTLIGLYRESGVTVAKLEALEDKQTNLSEEMHRLEDRITRELDALNLRIDRLLTSPSPRSASGGDS